MGLDSTGALLGAIGAAFVASGCSFTSLDDLTAAGSGGRAGEGGIGASASSGGATGGGGMGGGGGAQPVCGDKIIDPGEECDDGNELEGDGCSGCVVECSGLLEFKDPDTAHCYMLPDACGTAWSAARSACQGWGGDLAAITSLAESVFVNPYVSTVTWIGGTDAAQEGVFRWADGEPWSFAAWAPQQPDDNQGKEDCAAIDPNKSGWNDLSCPLGACYLCERPPAGTLP